MQPKGSCIVSVLIPFLLFVGNCLSEKELWEIAVKVPPACYFELASRLGISDARAEQIQYDSPFNTKNQIRGLLREWRNKRGSSKEINDQREELLAVIKECYQSGMSKKLMFK